MEFNHIMEFIKAHDKFIICAHESPDGDAVGSEYAMLCALKKIGKEAIILNSDNVPQNFKFVDATDEVGVIHDETQLPKNIKDWALLILDTNDIHNIGNVEKWILPHVKAYFIIDHHDSEGTIASTNLVWVEASSTAEILYQYFKKMNIEIDKAMAKSLFMAIVYDTGSFIYPKTSPLTFQIAYDLVSIGVNPNEIYENVYETNSIPSILLQSKVLSTIELKVNGHVAIQTMKKEMLEMTGASFDEGQALINIPLKARAIRVSVFFKENTDGVWRCSLRSKGDIDVYEIARDFGGGGHKTAAGFKFKETMVVMKRKILKCLKPVIDRYEEIHQD